MHLMGQLDPFPHFDGAQGEQNSDLPVMSRTPRCLCGLESMWLKDPELTSGACAVLLAGLSMVHSEGRGAVTALMGAVPLRKGAYREVPV